MCMQREKENGAKEKCANLATAELARSCFRRVRPLNREHGLYPRPERAEPLAGGDARLCAPNDALCVSLAVLEPVWWRGRGLHGAIDEHRQPPEGRERQARRVLRRLRRGSHCGPVGTLSTRTACLGACSSCVCAGGTNGCWSVHVQTNPHALGDRTKSNQIAHYRLAHGKNVLFGT